MDHERHEKHEIGFDKLVGLFEQTQSKLQAQAVRSVDIALVARNWLFGWYIVNFEKAGVERAELYGKKLMIQLSKELTNRLGKGFSKRSLELFRRFYDSYSEIAQTLSAQSLGMLDGRIQQTMFVESFNLISETMPEQFASCFKLGWSHYVTLLTISSAEERRFYEIEAAQGSWSVRELKRQIESSLFERLALSRDKKKVKELSQNVTAGIYLTPSW